MQLIDEFNCSIIVDASIIGKYAQYEIKGTITVYDNYIEDI